MEYPFWVWILFFAVVLTALAVDLGIANRKSHAPKRSETLIWSAVWVSLALLFNGFILWQFGGFKAKEFLTGYIIELSLSVDNLFVFLLIFNFFKVPKKYQHRALFWGIFMALVLRMVMIFAGAELVERFNWILYFFGAFLIYTGLKMFGDDDEFDPEESAIVRFTTKFVRISKHYDGEKFFVRDDAGRRTGTLLLLVLIVINVADLVFAVDSIPAIFGITTDKFIVYTSNIFAILGLRTFFFLLLDMAEKFHFLKYGLAFVLSFIGLKMLLPLLAQGLIMVIGGDSGPAHFLQSYLHHEYEQAVINISLGVVIGAIVVSIILSLLFPQPADAPAEEE
ncbi:MAG: TerC family protein [Acidobacteria bacterium]|nr:TerC family protein [Acidobacteriota bacterium]